MSAVWLVWDGYSSVEPEPVAAHLTEEAAWVHACKLNGWGLGDQALWQYLEHAPYPPLGHTRKRAAREAAWQEQVHKHKRGYGLWPYTVAPLRLGAEGVPARWA